MIKPYLKLIGENVNDNLINENLDNESIIFNTINIEKIFSYETKIIDIDEDKEIKKESNFISQNDNLNSKYNKIIDDNQINQKYFFDDTFVSNNFEEYFLKNFNNIIGSNSNNQQYYILSDKKQNSHTLNKNKNAIFSIHKEKKKNNYFTITNEKTEYKSGNENNICILINNSEKEEKIETNFINKKRNRNIFRVNFEIFSPREYDNYSKRMINEVLNIKTNDNINSGKLFVTKFKKTKKSNRKDYSDNIRKKIKSGFHRVLKIVLNSKLKYAGSIFSFDSLPQVFISNISRKENRKVLNLTMEELLSKNFCLGKKKIKPKIIEKYDNNLKVLKYLEENKEISKKSNFNNIKNMKYYEVFNEYLNSKEFEKEILKLKKKENDIYIRNYIRKAIHLIDFFNN